MANNSNNNKKKSKKSSKKKVVTFKRKPKQSKDNKNPFIRSKNSPPKLSTDDKEKRENPKEKKYDKPKSSVKIEKKVTRLNKYIANSGVCSRREADEYIKKGSVKINDEKVTEVGTQVKPTDEVKLNGKVLTGEQKVYLLLNKPKDHVTTVSDPHAEKTVLHIVKNACTERIYPVGRLDKATTGVLLLTNDGDLTKKLTHPKYNKKKVYHAILDKPLIKSDFDRIANGVELEDGVMTVDGLSYVDQVDKRHLGVEIHSGKNRIVRRVFEKVGYKVVKLDRTYFAGLTKQGLRRGHWRFLKDKEIAMLKKGSYK